MAYGPGRYDDIAVDAMKEAEAQGVLLLIFKGKKGSGFSFVGDINIILMVPEILRQIAKEIEKDLQSQ